MTRFSRLIACAGLLVATLSLPIMSHAQKHASQKSATASASVKKSQQGLFHYTLDSEGHHVFTLPDSLLGREMLVTVRYTSTPAGCGLYGGELANQQTVYWQLVDNDRLLLRARLLLNVADSTDMINRAVRAASADPVIASFKVKMHNRKGYAFDAGALINEDITALSISRNHRRTLGLQGYISSLSYIERVATFPTNTEIRVVRTWSSPAGSTYAGRFTDRVTLGMNISFILLPKEPMMRRLFDPRVGYFTDAYYKYSDAQQQVEPERFITRWRLEPKDSADAARMQRGELVEPRKPIVYYIDPATPKKWRPYLIQGVNDWQKAFEKAGFKNAIMAKEWPENDSTMSMEDARFSVIRYLASNIENAYGPHVHDPRSGEILESHICWYHNVMSLVHDWYMVQASSIDEAARTMNFSTELMGELIRFVSSHEVGHTLGLRHNFGSSSLVPVDSLRSRSFVEAHGHTPSIMDYARFNYVAQPEDSISRQGIFPRIGDYDLWAIQWGYTPMPKAYDATSDHWELEKLVQRETKGKPRLWFGDGETNRTNDPRCLTEDLGDDAVKASEYGIRNLQRQLKHLPEWTYRSSDIYGTGLSTMYSQHLNQFKRYCGHVIRHIGGTFANYKTADEDGVVYTYQPRQKEVEALDFIDRHVLHEPRWLIQHDYIKRFAPEPQVYTLSLGIAVVRSLYANTLLNRLTPAFPVSDYLPMLNDRVFASVKNGATPSDYTQSLQREAVKAMLAIYADDYTSQEVRVAVWSELRKLSTQLKAVSSRHAHYALLHDDVQTALEHRKTKVTL